MQTDYTHVEGMAPAVARVEKKRLPLVDRMMIGFLLIWGAWVALPFLAPVAMRLGWTGVGNAIYTFYSFQCHQLPQRSFFLFGRQFTYSLATIQGAWQNTENPAVLRQFVGNPAMGWKVAWSDRMVSMYTSVIPLALGWWGLRRKIGALPLWGLALCLLPMGIDGLTHLISDFAGLGQGFRDSNAWLAALTGYRLPASFYAGEMWGSFNSMVRILTGVLFAVGLVGYALPRLAETVEEQGIR